MRAAIAQDRAQPWAFDVIPLDHARDRRRLLAQPLELREPVTVSVDMIRDQREQDPGESVALHDSDRVLHLIAGNTIGLEIDSAKSVDLKVEQPGGSGRG